MKGGYPPELILIFVGEIKKAEKIDPVIKNLFRKNVIKWRSLNTWIITGGLNSGVDKLVGEAVDQDLKTSFLPVFGITSLNKLSLDFNNDSSEVCYKN